MRYAVRLVEPHRDAVRLLTRTRARTVPRGVQEETITTTEIDAETNEELIQTTKRTIPLLFVRGDVVILIAPPLRTQS